MPFPKLPRRLVDKLYETVTQRLRPQQTPTPEPTAPTRPQRTAPTTTTGDEALDQLVRSMSSPGQLTLDELQRRLQAAAQNRLQARMMYNGVWRNFEPMSYRYRAKEQSRIPLVYGWCWKDRAVECFKLQKIGSFQLTYLPYRNPTDFPIEALVPISDALRGGLLGPAGLG